MKTFAFYKKVSKDKTEITVYRIMRNKPVLVGITYYYNGSNCGAKSEVFQYLIDEKELPASYRNLSKNSWCGSGYYTQQVEKKGIKIIEL